MKAKPYQRVVVHAGLHKTGTTSIQDSCYRHRDLLLEHGIAYPVFTFRERNFFNHSDPLAAVFCRSLGMGGFPRRLNIEGNAEEAISVFSGQLQQVLEEPAGETLLLSAELVCDFSKKDMLALRRYLEKHAGKVQVIAFVRSPTSSLESILQQRSVSGRPADPASLVGLVTARYHRLLAAFSDVLKIFNYHDAVDKPVGLVGHLLMHLGLPEEVVSRLEFDRANQRFSVEAYRIMEAINRAYPAGVGEDHTVRRVYHDMRPLYSVTGDPFRIENFLDSQLYEELTRESESLEQELAFLFPKTSPTATGPLWQEQTLAQAAAAIASLENPALREVAKKVLLDEAGDLQEKDSDTAAVLSFIARQVDTSEELATEAILDKLGADYFKFSALQVERGSSEMALLLMLLARRLRPDAPFIKERISHYRQQLKKT
ncbi:MAG: hypothetical protein ACR2P1_19165 [Pseudomonadales bacterium]